MEDPPRWALHDARVEVSASRVAFSTGESLDLSEAEPEEEESLLDLWISCCSGAGGIVSLVVVDVGD